MTYDFLTTKYRDGQVVHPATYPLFIRFIPSLQKVAIFQNKSNGYVMLYTAEELASSSPNGLEYFPAAFYGLLLTEAEAVANFGYVLPDPENPPFIPWTDQNSTQYTILFGEALGTYLANAGTPRRAVALAALRGQDFAKPAAPAAPAAPTTGQAIANAFKQVFKI